MAASAVAVCNIALFKLGQPPIAALTETTPAARTMNLIYVPMRDRELRAHPWSFARSRTVLAPHATAPAFDFAYAFPLPSDCLRPLPPGRFRLDWTVERHQGVTCLLTNDGTSVNLKYIARVDDATAFDPLFDDALACRLAYEAAEKLTQSNSKKEAAWSAYLMSMREARKANAFEQISDEAPEDDWLQARDGGHRGW